jgi:CheY-like chemotaxis protein
MTEGQEPQAHGLEKCRVMLIDDDEDIRTVLSEALQDVGYEICCAASGREALTRLRSGYRPALILLDLMMPIMDGWQFRQEQLENPELAPIPVVVISAVNPGKALPQGTVLLRKPFDLDVMLAEVERATR